MSKQRKRRKHYKHHPRIHLLHAKWREHKAGRPMKPKKPGDRLSWKEPNGRRVSGKVVSVHRDHIIAERKGQLWVIKKGSILYRIGHAIGSLAGRIKGTVQQIRAGYETEKEAAAEYARQKRLRRLAEIREAK